MAVDFFLKIDGIKGESKDKAHADEIDISSWSWGESNTGGFAQGGGGGAGKVNMQDFNFTMTINRASPELIFACASGKHIKSAQLTCRKAGEKQQEYLKVYFTDLLVSSFQTGGAGGAGELPIDNISLNYATIKFEYAPQKADGTLDTPVVRGWNLKENIKI